MSPPGAAETSSPAPELEGAHGPERREKEWKQECPPRRTLLWGSQMADEMLHGIPSWPLMAGSWLQTWVTLESTVQPSWKPAQQASCPRYILENSRFTRYSERGRGRFNSQISLGTIAFCIPFLIILTVNPHIKGTEKSYHNLFNFVQANLLQLDWPENSIAVQILFKSQRPHFEKWGSTPFHWIQETQKNGHWFLLGHMWQWGTPSY